VRGLLIYCYHCSHPVAISADQWPDDVRLSSLESLFVCPVCGKKGAEVRPDFQRAESRTRSAKVFFERTKTAMAKDAPAYVAKSRRWACAATASPLKQSGADRTELLVPAADKQ
jgi:hypothetical protein